MLFIMQYIIIFKNNNGKNHRDTVDYVWDLFNGPACHYGRFMEWSTKGQKEGRSSINIMNWIKEMITSPRGAVSSKRVIGSVSYIILTISVIVLCFVNPSFKNLDDILETLIFASTTMLGLTTFENVKNKTKKEEDNANQEI